MVNFWKQKKSSFNWKKNSILKKVFWKTFSKVFQILKKNYTSFIVNLNGKVMSIVFPCLQKCLTPFYILVVVLTEKRLLERLVEMYSRPESTNHEHILSAINVLIEDNPTAINQAKNMTNLNLKQILHDRLDMISEDPRYLEEKEMATKIFEGLFQN